MQSYNRPTATLCMSGYPLATCCALPERRVLLAPRTPPRRLRARAWGGHAAHGGTRGPLRRARGPRDRPSTRARGAAAGPGPDPRPPPGYFRPFPRTLAPSAVRRRPGPPRPARRRKKALSDRADRTIAIRAVGSFENRAFCYVYFSRYISRTRLKTTELCTRDSTVSAVSATRHFVPRSPRGVGRNRYTWQTRALHSKILGRNCANSTQPSQHRHVEPRHAHAFASSSHDGAATMIHAHRMPARGGMPMPPGPRGMPPSPFRPPQEGPPIGMGGGTGREAGMGGRAECEDDIEGSGARRPPGGRRMALIASPQPLPMAPLLPPPPNAPMPMPGSPLPPNRPPNPPQLGPPLELPSDSSRAPEMMLSPPYLLRPFFSALAARLRATSKFLRPIMPWKRDWITMAARSISC